MTDYFAILDQPRRPWLEADAVKAAFHRASAILHPDVPGTGDAAQFAALNAAHTTLREPAGRLRHLLELIAPEVLAAAAAPPAELGDLFMRIASARQKQDALLKKRRAASSPLALALLAGEGVSLQGEWESVQAALENAEATTREEVRKLDSTWDPSSESLASLGTRYRRLSYLARWLTQTREALFALAT